MSDHRTILEDHIYSNKHVTSNRKDHYNVIHTLYNSIRLNYDIETDELLNMYVKFKKKKCARHDLKQIFVKQFVIFIKKISTENPNK